MADDKDRELKPDIVFERRRFVRVKGNFVVSYKDITTKEAKTDVSQTKDISVGGLLFTSQEKFALGTILSLKLRLPDSYDYINVKVEVVASKQLVKDVLYDIRAKFVKIGDVQKDYIRKMIDYNLKNKPKG